MIAAAWLVSVIATGIYSVVLSTNPGTGHDVAFIFAALLVAAWAVLSHHAERPRRRARHR